MIYRVVVLFFCLTHDICAQEQINVISEEVKTWECIKKKRVEIEKKYSEKRKKNAEKVLEENKNYQLLYQKKKETLKIATERSLKGFFQKKVDAALLLRKAGFLRKKQERKKSLKAYEKLKNKWQDKAKKFYQNELKKKDKLLKKQEKRRQNLQAQEEKEKLSLEKKEITRIKRAKKKDKKAEKKA